MTELGLFIVVYLSIDNPNKKCIVVPFINTLTYIGHVITQKIYKYSWITLIICVSPIPTSLPKYCNN